jgi:hypothetical protein
MKPSLIFFFALFFSAWQSTAQTRLSTNMVSPANYLTSGANAGGIDIWKETFGHGSRSTKSYGLEISTFTLANRSIYDTASVLVSNYRIGSSRVGLGYKYKRYGAQKSTADRLPIGFFYGLTANASLGYTFENHTLRPFGGTTFGNPNFIFGLAGNIGYTFSIGKKGWGIEPALRLGLHSPSATPPDFYQNSNFGGIDRAVGMIRFSRFEINLIKGFGADEVE